MLHIRNDAQFSQAVALGEVVFTDHFDVLNRKCEEVVEWPTLPDGVTHKVLSVEYMSLAAAPHLIDWDELRAPVGEDKAKLDRDRLRIWVHFRKQFLTTYIPLWKNYKTITKYLGEERTAIWDMDTWRVFVNQ